MNWSISVMQQEGISKITINSLKKYKDKVFSEILDVLAKKEGILG